MTNAIKVKIRGVSPLIMHRYAGQGPSESKPPRGKKTQEWIDDQRKRDWLQSAYFDADHQTFCIPPENLEALLVSGAKRSRRGMDFKAAVAVQEDFVPLIVYKGPTDEVGHQLNGRLEAHYIPEHIDVRGVVIGKARVDRCRPIFRHWSFQFTIMYDSGRVEFNHLSEALSEAGLYVGFGDYRPRYGRFKVEEFHAI